MSYQPLDARPKLKALFGANGILTSHIENAKDVWMLTGSLFEIDESKVETLEQLESAIDGLGKSTRRVLVRKNLKHLPARLVSAKPAHNKKRLGVMTRRDKSALSKLAERDLERAKWERR